MRMLDDRRLREKVILSRVQIWRLEKKNLFPKRIHLGRRVVWDEEEVDEWLRLRKAERHG